MFSCVNIRDQAAATVPGLPNRSSVTKSHEDTYYQEYHAESFGHDVEDEEGNDEISQEDGRLNLTEREMLDRVLEEGMRLKSKCKQLRFALLQQEQLILEERQNFSRKIDDMHITMETTIAEMRAKHFLEVTHVRDHRMNEVQDLTDRLQSSENDISYYQNLTTSYDHQLQELQANVQYLEEQVILEKQAIAQDARFKAGYKEGLQFQANELDLLQDQTQRTIQNLTKELEILQAKYVQVEEEKRSVEEKLLMKNITNNTTNTNTCSMCTPIAVKLEESSRLIQELHIEKNTMEEEKKYYYDETCRLEKQIHALKSELLSYETNYRTSSGLSTHQTGNEREQWFLNELQLAKTQIVELNQALEALLLTKADVEDAVHRVTKENQRLSATVYETQRAMRSKPNNTHETNSKSTDKNHDSERKSDTNNKATNHNVNNQSNTKNSNCIDSTYYNDSDASKIRESSASQSQTLKRERTGTHHPDADKDGNSNINKNTNNTTYTNTTNHNTAKPTTPSVSPGYRERCMVSPSHPLPHPLPQPVSASGQLLSLETEPLQIDVLCPSITATTPSRPDQQHDHHQLPAAVPSARRKKLITTTTTSNNSNNNTNNTNDKNNTSPTFTKYYNNLWLSASYNGRDHTNSLLSTTSAGLPLSASFTTGLDNNSTNNSIKHTRNINDATNYYLSPPLVRGIDKSRSDAIFSQIDKTNNSTNIDYNYQDDSDNSVHVNPNNNHVAMTSINSHGYRRILSDTTTSSMHSSDTSMRHYTIHDNYKDTNIVVNKPSGHSNMESRIVKDN